MNDSPLISVIIPVYKVEKYLDRCVTSVVRQTYGNLEIILVDDGSPDKCPEMCDAWAAKDPRIKVIHKENGGLSDARNAALDVMSGDFVTFVDSDDWLSEHYCSVLMHGIVADNADISIVNYKRVKDGDTVDTEPSGNSETIDSKKAIRNLYGNEQIMFVTAWGKAYRRGLFSDIRFPFGKLHEDDFTTYKLYDKAERITVCRDKLYAYFINDNSIIGKYTVKRLDALDAQKEKYEFVASEYPQLEVTAKISYFGACRYHFQMLTYHKELDRDKKLRKSIIERIKEIDPDKIKKYYRGKERLWFDLFLIAPYTTSRVRNLLKIGW